MSEGTKYETKSGLLDSIKTKIFTNTKFLVSADKIQTAINNVVESLWDRFLTKAPVILTITDDNTDDYLVEKDVAWELALENIPLDVTILNIETTTRLQVCSIVMPSNYNGKILKIIGNIQLWQDSGFGYDGVISQYYYTFRGFNGTYSGPVAVEGFEDFMYWNGTWYYNGY